MTAFGALVEWPFTAILVYTCCLVVIELKVQHYNLTRLYCASDLLVCFCVSTTMNEISF